MDRGVKTVVLDECHHLLDYWAVVLVPDRAHQGPAGSRPVTATLPSPEDGNEYENYTSLLGDVDFEVRPRRREGRGSGALPGSRLFHNLQPREVDYLNNVQRAFEAEISHFTRSEALQNGRHGPCSGRRMGSAWRRS